MKTRLILLGIAAVIVVAIIILLAQRCPCVTQVVQFFGYQCAPEAINK